MYGHCWHFVNRLIMKRNKRETKQPANKLIHVDKQSRKVVVVPDRKVEENVGMW